MAFFDNFTDSIKQKWLQFFDVNRDWIILQMVAESVHTPDGGKRPSSYLILGVVNALEPKLAQLMFPFAKLNPDADTLIDVLGLNFDPDIVLGNRLNHIKEEQISKLQVSTNADFIVVEKDDLVANSDGFDDTSISQKYIEVNLKPALYVKEDEDEFDSLNQPDETEFRDVISDVWGDDSSLEEGEENNNLSGEELSSKVFDKSEMARLFPNNPNN